MLQASEFVVVRETSRHVTSLRPSSAALRGSRPERRARPCDGATPLSGRRCRRRKGARGSRARLPATRPPTAPTRCSSWAASPADRPWPETSRTPCPSRAPASARCRRAGRRATPCRLGTLRASWTWPCRRAWLRGAHSSRRRAGFSRTGSCQGSALRLRPRAALRPRPQTILAAPAFTRLDPARQRVAADVIAAKRPRFEEELRRLFAERPVGYALGAEDMRELLARTMAADA